MSFFQAISVCFSKYVEFSGRARRAEYWYWVLFAVIASIILGTLDSVLFPKLRWEPLSTIFGVATFLPGLAVGVRRLHDIDRSGWWMLIVLIPLIGWIILIVWAIRQGGSGPNRFGFDPLEGEPAPPATP
jgi:uncharacterized membrane protein YhaH (DUF805 family)